MRKYLTVVASFVIMLCIGSVYAWSIIASELILDFAFSALQTQLIFGTLIAIFPITMIFVGQLGNRIKHQYLGYIAGLLFLSGYLIAGYSQGNFFMVFVGIGILSGIATGFGYWVSLTLPVQCFPHKKGFITGIAAAGFGLGALFMSELAEIIFTRGYNVLYFFRFMGICYGLIMIFFSNFFYLPQLQTKLADPKLRTGQFIKTQMFKKLFLGIFLGTFSGLLVIGSLKLIGGQFDISNHILILGVAFFAIANFGGRLIWGYISDQVGASLSIFMALLFQAVSIFLLSILNLNNFSYSMLAILIGFGFGGNFVLFAKETAQIFGVNNLGLVYPFVFIGYAIAGIAGPLSGGLLYDLSATFGYALALAALMSLGGSLIFFQLYLREKKHEQY